MFIKGQNPILWAQAKFVAFVGNAAANSSGIAGAHRKLPWELRIHRVTLTCLRWGRIGRRRDPLIKGWHVSHLGDDSRQDNPVAFRREELGFRALTHLGSPPRVQELVGFLEGFLSTSNAITDEGLLEIHVWKQRSSWSFVPSTRENDVVNLC